MGYLNLILRYRQLPRPLLAGLLAFRFMRKRGLGAGLASYMKKPWVLIGLAVVGLFALLSLPVAEKSSQV